MKLFTMWLLVLASSCGMMLADESPFYTEEMRGVIFDGGAD